MTERRHPKKLIGVALVLFSLILGYSGPALRLSSGQAQITTSCRSAADCPKEDVSTTKHNLSANRDIQAVGTTEVCIFCHTPHGANPNAGGQGTSVGAAPLWNRLLPSSLSFTPYSAPNFDAAGIDTGRPKGVSLACLSCHDGTIAFDAFINAPLSGGFRPENRGTAPVGPGPFGATDPAFVISGPFVDADHTFSEDPGRRSLEDPSGALSRPPVPFPNLGQNLLDDHPLGMAIPLTDPQFSEIVRNATVQAPGDPPGRPGTTVWFLKRDKQTFQPDKRDRVRAYPSTGGSTANEMYIECASCHNPHTPRPLFLRLPMLPDGSASADPTNPNERSALCLTCHAK